MQHIQWFPGHMTKSVRMMEECVKLCDGIIFILDARAPFACINENLLKIFGDKPVLYVLNKADLVEKAHINAISTVFKRENRRVVSINGTLKKDVSSVYNAICEILSPVTEKYRAKGFSRPLRVMVAGVPNTGKSTIINSLCGEKRAVTGDKAGVTRGKQWIKLKDIELLDTPGTMPPRFENQYYAKHLAYIGSINDDILDKESLCLEFLTEMQTLFPLLLCQKYNLKEIAELTPIEVFDEICRKRGFIFRGREPDYERGARAVLDDFRKGRIGKICLEVDKHEEKDGN